MSAPNPHEKASPAKGLERALPLSVETINKGKHNHGNEGPEHKPVSHVPDPYWKRAHRDWRFWIGVFLMMIAITIFALSDNLALIPPRPITK